MRLSENIQRRRGRNNTSLANRRYEVRSYGKSPAIRIIRRKGGNGQETSSNRKKRSVKLSTRMKRLLMKMRKQIRRFYKLLFLLIKNVFRHPIQTTKSLFDDVKNFSLLIYKYLPLGLVVIASVVRGIETFITHKHTSFGLDLSHVSLFTEETHSIQGDNVIKTALGHDSIVTSKYGKRHLNGHNFHHGIDIRAKYGEPVYSVIDGKVARIHDTSDGRGGRYVVVRSNDNELEYFVCHLSDIKVSVGDSVRKGDLIAHSGASGYGKEYGYAPHLHLELRQKEANGKYVAYDPLGGAPSTTATNGALTASVPKKRKVTPPPQTNTDNDILYGVAYLMNELSLTPSQACGIVGNLLTESNLNPYAWNKSGGGRGAQGIAQWRGVRVAKYKEIYGHEPKDDGTILHQFEYVVYEFTHSKHQKKLQECEDIDSATDYVMSYYERPNSRASYKSRLKNAERAYELYTNTEKKPTTVKNNIFTASSLRVHSNRR